MAGRDKKLNRGEFVSLSKQIASDWQAFKREGESGTEILKRYSQTNIANGNQSKIVDGQFFDGFITAHEAPHDTTGLVVAEQHLENEHEDGKVLKQNRLSGVIIANCDMSLDDDIKVSEMSGDDAKNVAFEASPTEAAVTCDEIHTQAAAESFDDSVGRETLEEKAATLVIHKLPDATIEEIDPGTIDGGDACIEYTESDSHHDDGEPELTMSRTESALSLTRHDAMEPIDDKSEMALTTQTRFLSFQPLVSAGNRSLTKLVDYTATAYAYILLQLLFFYTVFQRLIRIK